ncbi:acyltransferase [Chitinophaga filiformis]|uniref:acyltransferase family protein n=1 Tax=Chitinophaga filiformis TaxID=104663 RepID=UPI001F464290|nr:acyltransferase [Chitinophaga filiformis]MCF6404795.1 acyltransferase [Chitinophaga filiformis]
MSQIPAPGKHFAGLDHLRAFAISFVFIYHYSIFQHPAWIDTIGSFGWTGVDLFFVLSGYLISSQLFAQISNNEQISFREFFLKRFFRIIPAYLTVLSLYFLVPAFREKEALPPLWKFLTFTQNIGLHLKERGTFSHAWSLCIEEQFYFLLPIILIMLVRWKALKIGPWLIGILFAGGFAIRLFCWFVLVEPTMGADNYWVTWYMWMYYPTFTRLDGLLTGVSIAAIFQFLPAVKQKIMALGNKLLLIGLVLLTGAWFLCVDPANFYASVFGFPLIAIGYGAMVAGAVNENSFLHKKKLRFTATLAMLSYGIYLSHKGVIHLTQLWVGNIGIEQNSTVMFIICSITSVLAALLLNRIIEKPFLKLRQRVLSPKKAPVKRHSLQV